MRCTFCEDILYLPQMSTLKTPRKVPIMAEV